MGLDARPDSSSELPVEIVRGKCVVFCGKEKKRP